MERKILGCETCGWDRICADSSREINYKAILKRKLPRCPAWKTCSK